MPPGARQIFAVRVEGKEWLCRGRPVEPVSKVDMVGEILVIGYVAVARSPRSGLPGVEPR